jgi:uncharacterized membrane protein YccC
MTGAQARYCTKVGGAAGLGYLLTQGNLNQYAIYSAFTAALVVGTSVGEDLATSANRVKGTFAGTAAAMVATALFGPNPLTVGFAVSVTAVIALVGGWGIQVARVGVTVCIITLVAHDSHPVQYDVLRAGNTLIGVVVGLAVSFFVWPVRGSELVKQATRDVLAASGRLLGAIERGEPELRPLQGTLHDALAAVIKAWRDMNREKRLLRTAIVEEAQVTMILRLGLDVLSCALSEPRADSVQELRARIDSVASTIAH